MTEIAADSTPRPPGPPPGVFELLRLGAGSAAARPFSSFLIMPLLVAVAAGGCVVPLVNLAFLLVGLAPVAGGLPAVALAVARGDGDAARRAWDGFRHFERCLSLLWVPYLIAIGAAVPLLFALWADRRLFYSDAHPAIFAVAGVLSLALFLGPLHRYAFAPFAVFSIERGTPFPAVLAYAATPMDRQRPALLVRLSGLALFGASGALLFGVGALVTAPWALVAAAHLYLRVRPDDVPTTPTAPDTSAL